MKLATLLAATLFASAAHAQVCDPASYTTDPSGFAGLAVHDYQAVAPYTQSFGHDEANPYTHDGIDYWPQFWATNSWCIPGMDSLYPSCGGTNIYLANPFQQWLKPAAPTEAVALRWGTQGPSTTVEVHLTDLTTRTFPIVGQTDFFGYCTGSPTLKVVKIKLENADGGVDDVSFGDLAAGPALTLSHPGLAAGMPGTVTVTGGTAGETVYLLYGLGLGSGPCHPGGLCADITSVSLVGTATADGAGTATFAVTPPAGSGGVMVGLQAAILRGPGGVDSVKSNVQYEAIAY